MKKILNIKTLNDLWDANKKLDKSLSKFEEEVKDYKDQKLVNSIIASKYFGKRLQGFSPDERQDFCQFLFKNYEWLAKLVGYYND
jgi:hypothetical protein